MTKDSSSSTNTDTISFSSRDHLAWSQKKHDMILNLGLTNNSETDQTPTPTRFIRNCEEVGLFQDLQNVNPFDEVFKKAVENPSAVNLQVPASTCDDTLHTPQIYPHLEEGSKFPNNDVSASNEYSLRSVIAGIDHSEDGDNPLIIVVEPEDSETLNKDQPNHTSEAKTSLPETKSTNDTREKIKAAIIQKSGGITPVPIAKLLDHEKHHPNVSHHQIQMAELVRQREANKAAQSRCRKRKQQEFEDMKIENKCLKRENDRLTSVNLYLQQTIKKLQEQLKEAESFKGTHSGLPAIAPTRKPTVDERISDSGSIDQVNEEASANDISKTVTVSSPQETCLSNNTQCSPTTLQNPISAARNTYSVILSKQVNIDNIAEKQLKPPPIAPKPVVVSLPVQNVGYPIGIPLHNIQHTQSSVVFVYPQSAQTLILPS